MRVLVVRSTVAHGSIYHRVDEPARAVQESGTDVDVVVVNGLRTTVRDGEITDVDAQGADVVVLQLPKTVGMVRCLRLLQAQGVAVVVEVDDLLSAVPFGSPSYQLMVLEGWAQHALTCAREADAVTVSSARLLREYAAHGRGHLVPNAIPRRIAELPPAFERSPETVSIGWAGTVAARPYDVQEMGSGLQQALDRTRPRSRFVVLGEKADIRQRMGLAAEPDQVPWVADVETYLVRLGELFDVGVAPVRVDRFNEAKSWLKPLEYAARGIFCVRSRIGEYDRLGLGLPARAAKDWAKWISVGVQDADRRREVAAAAREIVLARHLTEHTAEQWLGAWRAALDHRARVRVAARPMAGAARR
ncbi:glycosyltransferase family protein [Blastococcus litoris]|uniref:glycosyltransferase family protein n=1 Tax=Blastococcus litoris TaxID=2171622 RepID=UPI000E30837E|nr:glycosyltransferase [Blastococcus litoris]